LGFFFPADYFERAVDIIKPLPHIFQFIRGMPDIKMTGEVAVVNGFHELFQFTLRFMKEPVKVRQLPGHHRYQYDQIDKLRLNHGHRCQAEHCKHEYDADDYAKFETFKHSWQLAVGGWQSALRFMLYALRF
jgi:hypothetical protein